MTQNTELKSEGIRLEALCAEVEGARVEGDANTTIFDVQQDSRKVKQGDLFAIRKYVANYVQQALNRGAVAILCGESVAFASDPGVPVLRVPETSLRQAIGVLASATWGHPSRSLDVFAVTGTNGKSTTTHLLAQALDELEGRAVCAIVGTLGAKLGTLEKPTEHTTPDPDELARLLAWAKANGATKASIEASSHALHQQRLEATKIAVAGFSNLTQDHLDYHADMEAYFQAKRRLFADLNPQKRVICLDEWGARLAEEFKDNCTTVALDANAGAHIYPKSISYLPEGVKAEVVTPQGEVTIATQMVGLHNLANLLLALGMLLANGVELEKAAAALAKTVSPKGRLQRIRTSPTDPIVVVDYAHTPDALERVLNALRPMATKRLICVFGCGGDRDRTKRAPMGTIASKRSDIAVVTSDNPRSEQPNFIISDILMGMPTVPRLSSRDLRTKTKGVWTEQDRKTAIRQAILAASPEDLVLVAGKGHETYQIIGKDKLHFDDSEVAEAALNERHEKATAR